MTATKLISKKRDLSPIFLATIRSAVERIVVAVKPSKVILFGSYARGDADEGSDLDLMVAERDVVDKGQEVLKLYRHRS